MSYADESGIIQKRIIQNLYENPIVVCDVSGKNPNVMFELGMRLTFDKPTIVVKDDETDYSFDTSPIEHLGYPRSLRFSDIVKFKERLASSIKATYEKKQADKDYSSFLKNFNILHAPELERKEVSGVELLSKRLDEIERLLRGLRGSVQSSREHKQVHFGVNFFRELSDDSIKRVLPVAKGLLGLKEKPYSALTTDERELLCGRVLEMLMPKSRSMTDKDQEETKAIINMVISSEDI